jgi:hypothetical protein
LPSYGEPCRDSDQKLIHQEAGRETSPTIAGSNAKLDTMKYESYVPHSPLSEFVEMFWLYEGCGSVGLREAVFTDGRAEIIINLRDDPYTIFEGEPKRAAQFKDMVFCGPHTDTYLLDISTSFQLMGVVFKPHGATPFLPIPVSEVFGLRLAGDAL